jgi:hypothetical protein
MLELFGITNVSFPDEEAILRGSLRFVRMRQSK